MIQNSKLKNAPLKEVILEVTWEENIDEFGNKFDKGFELAQGSFSEKIKPSFPIHKKLTTNNQTINFGTPIHQYWTEEAEWPVIQHGQGILTINQVEEKYTWEEFKNLVLNIIEELHKSYNYPLKFNSITLEYLDAFDLNRETNIFNFIEDNLQTSVNTRYELPGKLSNIKINRRYTQEDGSWLNINISDAVNNLNDNYAIIMLTTATKEITTENDIFEKELDALHDLCSNVFKTILDKKFYGSLNQ